MSCYQKYRIGEHKTFKSKAWKYWGFECSECGVDDKDVVTLHHVEPEGDRFDMENVRPLCANCHLKLNKGLLKFTKKSKEEILHDLERKRRTAIGEM